MAAFPGSKNCDGGIDFGADVVLAEVVSGTVKLGTRERANVTSFKEDADRLVLEKARQLQVTAINLLSPAPPANSPLGPAPRDIRRLFPVLILGGQFPVNPLTSRYISEQLTARGLMALGGDPAARTGRPGRVGGLRNPPPPRRPDSG